MTLIILQGLESSSSPPECWDQTPVQSGWTLQCQTLYKHPAIICGISLFMNESKRIILSSIKDLLYECLIDLYKLSLTSKIYFATLEIAYFFASWSYLYINKNITYLLFFRFIYSPLIEAWHYQRCSWFFTLRIDFNQGMLVNVIVKVVFLFTNFHVRFQVLP